MLHQSGPETIPSENFTVSWDPTRDTLMDQDYIHNIKKLANPLDHASKSLTIGSLSVKIPDPAMILLWPYGCLGMTLWRLSK